MTAPSSLKFWTTTFLGGLVFVLLPLFANDSAAQGRATVHDARPVGAYRGVRPGSANTPPRSAAAGRNRNTVVTWPGFDPRGGGRFFVQTTGNITTEVQVLDGRVEVLLRNVRTHLRNTRRSLETRFFNTPVVRARIERRGRHDLAFVFTMRSGATPSVTTGQGEGGYQFLYVDFPAGQYLAESTPSQTATADEPTRAPVRLAEENERPPGM